MFCTNCGAKLEANVKFCSQCGAPVAVVEPKVAPVVEPEQVPEVEPEKAPVVETKPAPEAEPEKTPVVETKPAPKVEPEPETAAKPMPVIIPASGSNAKESAKPSENAAPKEAPQPTGGFTVNVSGVEGNLMDYLFSTQGRVNRQKYIIYSIALMIVNAILEAIPFVGWLLSFAVIYSMLTFEVRRLHDMAQPEWPAYVCFILTILAVIGLVPSIIFGAAFGSGLLAELCGLIILGNIAFSIYLMCVKGTDGPNQYGPDPLAK